MMTLTEFKKRYEELADQKPVHRPDDDPNYYEYDEAMDDWNRDLAELVESFFTQFGGCRHQAGAISVGCECSSPEGMAAIVKMAGLV